MCFVDCRYSLISKNVPQLEMVDDFTQLRRELSWTKNNDYEQNAYVNRRAFMVPTRTGKPEKTGEHFPVRESQGNFVKTVMVKTLQIW